VKVINRISNNRSSVCAEIAVKLASAFQTSPEFWLNAQQAAVDVFRARQKVLKIPEPLIHHK
jgi:addiction module HigA family antidote